jgi:hypothetical protein
MSLALPVLDDFTLALLAALSAGVLALLVLASLRSARARHLGALAQLRREIAALRDEARAAGATIVTLATNCDRLVRERATDARHGAPVQAGAALSGYELAIRLARGGAQVAEIVSSCAMSRREAELILRLHAPAARAPGTGNAPRSH